MTRSAVAALVLLLASPAAARDIAVEVDGCPALASSIATALRLEVSERWAVVDDAGVRLRVEVSDCDAPRWVLRVVVAGRDVHGPEPVAMDPFATASRARIAALWAAERLPGEGVSRGLDSPRPAAAPTAPPPVPPVDLEAEPEAPVERAPPWFLFTVSLGAAGIEDPAALANWTPLSRVGFFAQIDESVLLGGSIEGGALIEPYNHVQPLLRFCAEPQLTFSFGDPRDTESGLSPSLVGLFELAFGPRICGSVSRHIRSSQDEWTSGTSFGVFVYLGVYATEGLSFGLRFDVDGWERDWLAETSPASFGGAVLDDLPWVGVFAGSIEMRVR